MAPTLRQLRQMTEEQLVQAHDQVAQSTMVSINYYLEELARRRGERQATVLTRLTWAIAALTLILAIVAAVDVWLRLTGR